MWLLHSQTIIKSYVPLSWSLPQGGPCSVDDPCHSFILTWCWLQLDFLHLHFHIHNSLLVKEELCSSNAAHTFMPLVTLLSFSHFLTSSCPFLPYSVWLFGAVDLHASLPARLLSFWNPSGSSHSCFKAPFHGSPHSTASCTDIA